MIKKENFVTIQGWMLSELKLKGNELLVYAIIYGFSQDGKSWFKGSHQYLAEWTNITRPNVIEILKRLEEKKLILKKKYRNNQNTIMVAYQAIRLETEREAVMKHYRGCNETLQGGCNETLHNNIDINNINNNDNTDNIYNPIVRKLLDLNFLNENDNLEIYSKLFEKLAEQENFNKLEGEVMYIAKQLIKNKFKDENGKIVINKYGYLKNALEFNFDKFKNKDIKNDDEYDWLNDAEYP